MRETSSWKVLVVVVVCGACTNAVVGGVSAQQEPLSPTDWVVAFRLAETAGDYDTAYALYPREDQLNCAELGASEVARRSGFRQMEEETRRRLRLQEVRVGRPEVADGESLDSADRAVVLTSVRGEVIEEGWEEAAFRVWQGNIYWLFERTEEGWRAVSLVGPSRVAAVLPGPRVEVGASAAVLHIRDSGVTVERVDDIAPVPDTRARIKEEGGRVAEWLQRKREAPARRLRLALVAVGIAMAVAGILLLAYYRRRVRHMTTRSII